MEGYEAVRVAETTRGISELTSVVRSDGPNNFPSILHIPSPQTRTWRPSQGLSRPPEHARNL